jgi:hypothetical protein
MTFSSPRIRQHGGLVALENAVEELLGPLRMSSIMTNYPSGELGDGAGDERLVASAYFGRVDWPTFGRNPGCIHCIGLGVGALSCETPAPNAPTDLHQTQRAKADLEHSKMVQAA